jgi:hypothetical protein
VGSRLKPLPATDHVVVAVQIKRVGRQVHDRSSCVIRPVSGPTLATVAGNAVVDAHTRVGRGAISCPGRQRHPGVWGCRGRRRRSCRQRRCPPLTGAGACTASAFVGEGERDGIRVGRGGPAGVDVSDAISGGTGMTAPGGEDEVDPRPARTPYPLRGMRLPRPASTIWCAPVHSAVGCHHGRRPGGSNQVTGAAEAGVDEAVDATPSGSPLLLRQGANLDVRAVPGWDREPSVPGSIGHMVFAHQDTTSTPTRRRRSCPGTRERGVPIYPRAVFAHSRHRE